MNALQTDAMSLRSGSENSMNIAFVTPEYPHVRTGASGGIGTSLRTLAEGLVTSGQRVIMIVYGQSADEVFTDRGIEFHLIKNVRFKGFSGFLTQKKIQRYINRLHQVHKIDIVEAPDWTGITAFIRTESPLVLRLHGSDTYFCHLERRPVKYLNKLREKRAFKNADAIVSVSRYTAQMTNNIYGTDRKVEVIPNCVEVPQAASDMSSVTRNILYFGTLIRKKGLLELPQIFNLIHKHDTRIRLVLAGRDSADISTGSQSTWALMQPLFDASALANVDYLGALPHNEIKALIAAASVCVFPTFAEALPVSWLEAMAVGKPIVASNIGWADEIIDDGRDGFLVHPADHTNFASRVIQLLEDNGLRTNIAASAHQKAAEKFSVPVIVNRNLEFYKHVARKNDADF